MPDLRDPHSEIRLLISDVDGTLVTRDKVLTPATLAAVQSLGDAGIGFTLTSARPPRGLRMLIEPLDLRLPMAGFNGGLIVDRDLQVLESHPLDPAVAQAGAQLMQDHGLDLWVYTEEEWLVSAADGPHVTREAWILQQAPVARPVTPADFARAFKIVGVSDDRAKIIAAGDAVAVRFGDAVSATRSETAFLDITDRRANKGAVVHALASRLGIQTSAIATIGDMPNDMLMFAQSGFSIAMGNASDAVKAAAGVVTASNEEDGFAKAVRQFILAGVAK